MTLTLTPAASTGGNPIRHARHSGRPAGSDELPDAAWPSRLDVEVVLGQSDAREQPEQGVIGRVLKGHDRDGLSLQVRRLFDAGIFANNELHETSAAKHGDDLDGDAVLPDHDRAVGDDSAQRSVARADLLGDVDAAAAESEIHVNTRLGEIAFALAQADRCRRPAGSEAPGTDRSRYPRPGGRHREKRRRKATAASPAKAMSLRQPLNRSDRIATSPS